MIDINFSGNGPLYLILEAVQGQFWDSWAIFYLAKLQGPKRAFLEDFCAVLGLQEEAKLST
jgi:hypothetical protein